MTNKYEQRYLIDLAFRIAHTFPARSAVAQVLSNWLEDQDFGFTWEPDVDNFRRKGVPVPIWSDLQKLLADRKSSVKRPKPDLLHENVTLFANHVGLSSNECLIFELAVRAARKGPIRSLCDGLVDDARVSVEEAITKLTGLSATVVRAALSYSDRLCSSGLVRFEKPPFTGLGLAPLNLIVEALEPPSRGLDDILGKLFAHAGPSSVAWEDFEHLGASRDFAFRLLRGALGQREKGVNILLYGLPGTGKTEFCKALAEQLGATLHAVGEADDDGE